MVAARRHQLAVRSAAQVQPRLHQLDQIVDEPAPLESSFSTITMAAADVAFEWCLLVLALVPWVTVVGYERVGHRHNARVLAELDA